MARCRKAGVDVPPLPAGAQPQCTKNPTSKETSMSENTIHQVGIIMNGVTGRMGLNQHLRRSIYAHHAAGRPQPQ